MSRRYTISIAGVVGLTAVVFLGPLAEEATAQGVSISIGSRRGYSGFRYSSYPSRSYYSGYGFRAYRPGGLYFSRPGFSTYPTRSYSYGSRVYGGYSYRPSYSSYYNRPGFSYYSRPYGYSNYVGYGYRPYSTYGYGVSVPPACVW